MTRRELAPQIGNFIYCRLPFRLAYRNTLASSGHCQKIIWNRTNICKVKEITHWKTSRIQLHYWLIIAKTEKKEIATERNTKKTRLSFRSMD